MLHLATPITPDQVRPWLAGLVGPDRVGDDDALLTDLGWDSITLAEAVIAAEDDFGSSLPDELLVELRTVGDVIHYICTTADRVGDLGDDRGGVALVPVTSADEPMLFDWYTAPGPLQRFRLRAQTPSPEAFHRLLWDGVLSQFIVCRDDGVAVGLVSAFEADHRNRYAHLAAMSNPDLKGATAVPRALAQFITYLFRNFELRKLYAHMLDGAYTQVESGAGRLFRCEGRLVDHEFVDGRYEDLVLLSVHRRDWELTRHWRTEDRAAPLERTA